MEYFQKKDNLLIRVSTRALKFYRKDEFTELLVILKVNVVGRRGR